MDSFSNVLFANPAGVFPLCLPWHFYPYSSVSSRGDQVWEAFYRKKLENTWAKSFIKKSKTKPKKRGTTLANRGLCSQLKSTSHGLSYPWEGHHLKTPVQFPILSEMCPLPWAAGTWAHPIKIRIQLHVASARTPGWQRECFISRKATERELWKSSSMWQKPYVARGWEEKLETKSKPWLQLQISESMAG